MTPQLTLFEADRYHDPRIAADRARARSLAKLRPVRRCERHPDELQDRRPSQPRRASVEGAPLAA